MNYRENMFTSQIEERDFAIKPMNCPGCMLYYKSHTHSYRELPLRVRKLAMFIAMSLPDPFGFVSRP